MTLRERLGLPAVVSPAPATAPEPVPCACRFPERHYGSHPCARTDEELPLGPSGYCWSCWSARHDLPEDTRPEWVRRTVRPDLARRATKELTGAG